MTNAAIDREGDVIEDSRQESESVVSVEITVPLTPISGNHYKVPFVRGGRINWCVTAEAKAFKEAIALFARGQRIRCKFYAVEIYLCLGPKQRQDLDNCAKVILDGLVQAGVIDTDAKITCLTLHKKRATEPSTQITIWEGKKP